MSHRSSSYANDSANSESEPEATSSSYLMSCEIMLQVATWLKTFKEFIRGWVRLGCLDVDTQPTLMQRDYREARAEAKMHRTRYETELPKPCAIKGNHDQGNNGNQARDSAFDIVHRERPEGNLKQLMTMKVDEQKLKDILVVRNFPGVFQENLSSLPPSREVEFRIDLIHGVMLVAKSPYRLVPTEMQELLNQLKELQEKGLIRPSSSPWELLCCLLRRKMDGYGHFEFTVMPFGLTNAPAVFMDLMNRRNKVIAYASRQLKIHEKNYTTHDLELGAVARILEAQGEASKGANTPAEMLKEFGQSRTPETLGITSTAKDSRVEMGEYHNGLHNQDTTEKLARLYINEIVARHGVSLSILSDRDSYFTSRFWQPLQKALGTRLDLSTAYHPKIDGQSERTIQTLEDMLRAWVIDFGGNWDTIVFILNTKVHLTSCPKSYKCVFLGYSKTSKAYLVLKNETIRLEESLKVTFDESLPEPKSPSKVEDDRVGEPIVRYLNGSSSLQVNVSDEGYPKSLKEGRGHPIEQVTGELNERTLVTSVNFKALIPLVSPLLNRSLQPIKDDSQDV
ncbi:putative reverse transcriptase domain-containing protein [Tanacetum coccineum]